MKTTTSDSQPELLRRPVQRLYPLEVMGTSDGTEPAAENASSPEYTSPSEKPAIDDVGVDRSSEGDVRADQAPEPTEKVLSELTEPPTRPRRLAAQRGEEQRKACMIELDED